MLSYLAGGFVAALSRGTGGVGKEGAAGCITAHTRTVLKQWNNAHKQWNNNHYTCTVLKQWNTDH